MDPVWHMQAVAPLRGEARLPGDKSLTHRALILNGLAEGDAEVRGANTGADVASTRACLRALGVRVTGSSDRSVVHGRGPRWRPATRELDCGNSGTTLRLLAGILAAQPFTSTLDGDESLRGRPMGRIAIPLRRMGARVEGPSNGERPPLIITGEPLRSTRVDLNVASAQVKSCLLLAAQAGGVNVDVREPAASRDHTERMLAAMGADIDFEPGRARLAGGRPLRPLPVDVPGDPSAAALIAASALAVPGSDVATAPILAAPARTAFVGVLERMGAQVGWEDRHAAGTEQVGRLRVRSGVPLRATRVQADEVPALVDEVPALAVVAAQAEGTTVFEGVAELRVKESDRIAAIERLLAAFGVEAGSEHDRFWVRGGAARARSALPTTADHRIAMAAVALARVSVHAGSPCQIDLGPASVSFPDFRRCVEELERDR